MPTDRFVDLVGMHLATLRAAKPSPHTIEAYGRDLTGIGKRIAAIHDVALDDLTLSEIDKRSLRSGFASWASDHATSSLLRAWSVWNGFFDQMVVDDIVEGNPMGAVRKPRSTRPPAKVIRGGDTSERLLSAASTPDPRSRNSWPQRDVAVVATFCVTGIRLAELLSLTMSSIDGPVGARRLTVIGKGNKARTIPIDPALETVLDAYLDSRLDRFPDSDLDDPTVKMFVHYDGRPPTPKQIQYLIGQLYRRAGIRSRVPPGALVHALRHTFATQALETGADVVEVQHLLGHASLATTSRYLEATGDRLRDAVTAHPAQIALRAHNRESSDSS